MNTKRLYIMGFVTLLGLCCLTLAQPKKPPKPPGGGGGYTVVDLHPRPNYFESTAMDISDAGIVVGFARLNAGGTRGIAWTENNGVVSSAELDEGPVLPNSSSATSVAVDGAIAGSGNVLDVNNKVRDRGLFWASAGDVPILLEPPAGFIKCWPLGMSADASLVVGVAHSSDDVDTDVSTGVLWGIGSDQNGDPIVTDIVGLPGLSTDSAAYDATSLQNGVAGVVGVSLFPDGDEAIDWTVELNANGDLVVTNQVPVPTPNQDVSRATAVNDNGAVAGTSGSVGFVDSPNLTLEPLKRTFITSESVQDLNDAADPLVVGFLTDVCSYSRLGVLWTAGRPKNLDNLAGDSSFQTFKEAKGITNSGNMVGVGWSDSNQNHAFLMIKNQ
jgi:hypothetical protein